MGIDDRLLVLGVGNLLLGDEGVGVHAVRLLEAQGLPPEATVIDGGTGGFHLLSYFHDFSPVIMIDATMDGSEPGTVSLIRPRFASDFPRSLSAHDIGLRDLIESAMLLGPLPDVYLITVSIESVQSMVPELSPPIESVLPRVVAMVCEIVSKECVRNGGIADSPMAGDPQKR